MAHQVSPAAEALLDVWQPIAQGGLVLVDYMGTDLRVVQAARTSYGKELSAKDSDVKGNQGLINFMMREGHSSPFEQVVLTMLVHCPIAIKNQIVRHRTARMNEFSARYSEVPDTFYIPSLEDMRVQDKVNRQGSGGYMDAQLAHHAIDVMHNSYRDSYSDYTALLELGLAKERARFVLPQAIYTKFYWQMDLNNLFRFLFLRTEEHAQSEVRAFADAMGVFVEAIAPMCYAAWVNHVRDAITFSASEFRFIDLLLKGDVVTEDSKEAVAFQAKIRRLSLVLYPDRPGTSLISDVEGS